MPSPAVPDVFVLEALRTPRALLGTSPVASGDEDQRLAELVVRAVVARSGIDPKWIDLALATGAPAGMALEHGLGRAGLAITKLAGDGCGLTAFQHGALAVLSGLHQVVLIAASGDGAASSDGSAVGHAAATRVAARAGIDPEAVSAWVERSRGRVLAARQERTWLAETVDLAGDFNDAPIQNAIPAPPCLGAAALVLASGQAVRRFGLQARARVAGVWSATADVGLAPLAIIPAARRALEAAGITAAELDRVELDERWPAV
ncbi:MAG: hypothetical protein GXP62_06225, partial [Oligoflexia bacterium]|nr:hypothetical protein [Oligoflexia bacterium]